MRKISDITRRLLIGDMSDLKSMVNANGITVYDYAGAWRTKEGIVRKVKYKKGDVYKKKQAAIMRQKMIKK